ncbi:MAG: hypothetical protein JWQ03_3110 [Variovorax sp.]|nr:hypothetical protein [Variovorax sp.]
MGKILKSIAKQLYGPLTGLIVDGKQGFMQGLTNAATAYFGGPSQVALAVANAVVTELARKPSAQPSPINFRQSIANSFIIIGKRRAGGLMVFFHPRKTDKKHYRYFIFAAAGHRCHALTRWYLNDEVVSVNASTGEVTSGDYAGKAWLWFGRGTYDTDETPAIFRTECASKWTDSHVGYGVAKIYAKFQLSDDVVEAGMPTVSAEIEGSDEIRDPRTDVVGYTNLAVPAFYWWLSLPREEGGFGAADDEIPDDDLLSAWTNVCDEDVEIPGSLTEKRYTFDSRIETGAPASEVRQTFVTSCAGTFTFSEGKFLMRPGYWVPSSATLSEEDLAGDITVPLLVNAEEYANEVSGTFVDPDMLYQQQAVPVRRLDAGDVRQADYDLAHITSHYRAQRILEIMLRRGACEKRVTWPMNISGLATQAMQTVQLGTSRYGLSNYAFVIDEWTLTPDFGVTIDVREENEDIYELPVAEYIERSTTGTIDKPEPIGPEAPDEGSWTFTSELLTGDGVSIPALVFAGAVDDPNATDVLFEYAPGSTEPADDEWIGPAVGNKAVTRWEITSITSDTPYWGAVSYRVGGVTGERLTLGPVNTPGAVTAGATRTTSTGDIRVTSDGSERVTG